MSLDNLVGQTLAQYQLRELLGVGGMGAVYRAYQTNLKREVAVKVISPQLVANSEAMARFIREAEISAQLEHSNIVAIYDFGTQRGVTYVVMRLLTGGSLSRRIEQRIEEGRPLISLGETADLLKQVGSALDYAHSRGVIHRDIKPANIMFDNQGKPYVVDFGIAKITQGATSFTQTGTAMGTPNYMPPEQWRGEQPTPMSDQYALAVMIYQLLSGRMPFEADSAFALMHKHLNEQATPLNVFRPDIPPAVMLVLNRAMSKDYRQRFPSCTAFAQAFEAAIENRRGQPTGMFLFPVRPSQTGAIPISNRPYTPTPTPNMTYHMPPNTPYHPPPGGHGTSQKIPVTSPHRNNSNIIVMGILGVVSSLALIVVVLIASNNTNSNINLINLATNTDDPRQIAQINTDTAEAMVIDARSVAETLVAEENRIQNMTATINAELTKIRQEIENRNNTATATLWTATPSATSTPTTTSTPTITPSPTQTPTATSTNTPTATPSLRPSNTPTQTHTPTATFTPSITPTPTFTYTPTASPRPSNTPVSSRTSSTNIRATSTATLRAVSTISQQNITDAITFYNAGITLAEAKNYQDAISNYDRAIQLNPQYTRAYFARGNAYYDLGEYERAIEDYDVAIRLDPQYTLAYNNRGNAYYNLGEYERAIEDYDEAIRIDPQYTFAYSNRGNAYADLGEYERAIESYDEAIRLNPEYSRAYYARGLAYSDLGEYERAIEDYDEAIRLDPQYARAYYGRGLAYYYLENYNRAIENYDEAIRLDPQYSFAYNARGVAYIRLNNYEQAIANYTEAIRINPQYGLAYSNRAFAYYNWSQNVTSSSQIRNYREQALSDWRTAMALGYTLSTTAQRYMNELITILGTATPTRRP